MIAFASLFLGLMFGPRPVELVVGPEVAAVEIRLDGEQVALLREAPWVAPCDFGKQIQPRLLEAVAYDGANRELGRTEQWLNLPQPSAVLEAVLEKQPGGTRVARLSWESSAGAQPVRVDAYLDGAPLTVPDPQRIALPKVDEEQLHLLNVEMEFDDHVTTRVDLTFGGSYADEVSTEMTALPLHAVGKRPRAPGLEEVQGWIRKGEESLRVVAVEKEQMEVLFVMDRPFGRFFMPGERPKKMPKSLTLEEQHRMRFVISVPNQAQGVSSNFELFPISRAYGREVGDLYHLLTGIGRSASDLPARPSAAVAVAGLAAYESRRRRAVVLIPSRRHSDDTLDPAVVRTYLETLRVPFFVWDAGDGDTEQFAAWGTARKVDSLGELAEAFEELEELLDRQWVVWIDGKHLPQDISLAPEVKDFRLGAP